MQNIVQQRKQEFDYLFYFENPARFDMLVAKTIGWLNHEVPKLSLLSFINQVRQGGRDQTTLSGEMLHMNASLGSSVQNRNTQFT